MEHKKNKSLAWLFFDLNSFFASVEQQDQPALRNQPVAVVPMLNDSTCAIAASYEAKAYGIKTGTKIYEAKKLCPDLKCVLARHDVYVRYHKAIMASVENNLHIDKICSIDEAACRLPKQFQSVQSATDIALQIKQGLLRDVGAHIKCSIGLAGNMFLAKIATEIQKPDGLVAIMPGQELQHLRRLTLRDLTGIGHAMERRLNRAGITNVQQLWDTSPKQARQIWRNVGGERFWYKLHGYDLDDPPSSPSMIGHSRVLDPAHRPVANAYHIARILTLKAAQRLRAGALYARRFGLFTRIVDGPRWGREYILSPSHDDVTILRAFESLWADLAALYPCARLKKISVQLYDLFEKEQITLDLFETVLPENKVINHKRERLSTALDEITQRYGKDAIQFGQGCPQTAAGHVGTKIAFTRVPEIGEFD